MLLRFILLVSVLGVEGCGPARGGPHRHRAKKLTPLVFKQHEPNIDEKSIQASGLFESRIEKSSSKFKDLVLNYNPDIIFKDEEGTGADRLMTQRCMEKLNHLAISVMNTWPGLQLRVTEGWDEDGIHAKDSLHYEGRAVDITTSDKDRAKLGMLARLAVEAGFDWVYYESRSHIHCSVKSDRNILLRSAGCFKGDSTVETKNGVKRRLSELQIGEQILAYEPKSGKLIYSQVIFFLDRNPNATSLFMRLRTSSGKELTLTPTHLLPRRTSRDHVLETVFAARLSPGDQVLVSRDGEVTLEKVESVDVTELSGTYAPLTRAGTLLVDGVVASCYAVLESQPLAHYSFLPARILSSGRDTLLYAYKLLTGGSHKQTYIPQQDGVHWYTTLLNKTVSYILPSSFNYASYT